MMSRIRHPQFLIFLLYVVVAIAVTYPAIANLNTHFIGAENGDVYENVRHIWWIKHALQTGDSIVHQPLLGVPDGINGVTIWAHWLSWFPAWLLAFIFPLAIAYNLTIILTITLNGFAMYWVVHRLTQQNHHIPAIVAGVVFASAPAMQGHILGGHISVLVLWTAVLHIYALYRYLVTPGRTWLFLTILLFWLTSSSHVLQSVYVLVPFYIVFFVVAVWQRNFARVGRILFVGLLGVLAELVFLSPVLGDLLVADTFFERGSDVAFSADLLSMFAPPFDHPFYGDYIVFTRRVVGTNLGEGIAYLGLVPAFLGLIAFFRKRESRVWFGIALVAWLLSLGPLLKLFDSPMVVGVSGYETYITLPWSFLQHLPVFEFARTPARSTMAVTIAVSVIAGYGMLTYWEYLLREDDRVRPRYYVLAVLLLAFLVWETRYFDDEVVTLSTAEVSDGISQLQERGSTGTVFNIPWQEFGVAKAGLYFQTVHEQPMLAGQVTRNTTVNPYKLNLVEATRDPYLLQLLEIESIIHHHTYTEGGVLDVSDIGELFFSDETIAIYDLTSIEQALSVPDLIQAVTDETESITSTTNLFSFYLSEPGWIDFSAEVETDGRVIQLLLDDIPLYHWDIPQTQQINAAIPISSAGFHGITLRLLPPCPVQTSAENIITQCSTVDIVPDDLQLLNSGAVYAPIRFEQDVELRASYVPATAEDELPIRLWWHFASGRSRHQHIRFVHLLNSTGELVAQFDDTLGTHPPNREWLDQVIFDVSELPEGEYRVSVGWFTLPSETRLPILDDVPGSSNRSAILATIEITHEVEDS